MGNEEVLERVVRVEYAPRAMQAARSPLNAPSIHNHTFSGNSEYLFAA